MKKIIYSVLIVLFFLNSCGKDKKEISTIKENRQDLELVSTYKEAYKALDQGDPYFAAKKFLEAELLYPQSQWAPKSALMASYSYYMQNYYAEALANLERYLKTYPTDKNLDYAHYLIAMCYYETIEGEKNDSEPLMQAQIKFSYILKNYPDTDFALDAKFKLNLIQDLLASKEMYLGRHYIKKEKWIAALNRFKTVIKKYNDNPKVIAKNYDGKILPYEKNYFDRIIISHCLEHIIDPESFLLEMMKKLKKGGILSISLPTDPGLLFRLGRLYLKIFSIKKKYKISSRQFDYMNATEHVNSIFGLSSIIKYNYEDCLKESYLPFKIKLFDLNLFYNVHITKKIK